jgi:hypothetical protein
VHISRGAELYSFFIMMNFEKHFERFILPNRELFAKDPFGYSASACHKWGVAQTIAGYPIDFTKPPSSEELKSPLLWLTQARAMSEAAGILVQSKPDFETMPVSVRGVCDSQFCATILMLVGYSLEICLKGMIIMKKGVESYTSEERNFKHHKLEKLAEFIPALDEKELAILSNLSSFILWAGRYPDPGSGKESNMEQIFSLAEKHQISGHDLFQLSDKIMKYMNEIIDQDKK